MVWAQGQGYWHAENMTGLSLKDRIVHDTAKSNLFLKVTYIATYFSSGKKEFPK